MLLFRHLACKSSFRGSCYCLNCIPIGHNWQIKDYFFCAIQLRIPNTEDSLLLNFFHNMPHGCHSAHNILNHFLLPHRKHQMPAPITYTHIHTHTHTQTHLCRRQTLSRPTNIYSHIRGTLTHTGYIQLKRKALESTKYHFRAFPPFPMGNSVPGTALCSSNYST